MPGQEQNNTRKPNLSFGGTEAIRKVMLSKNLPNPMTSPYFDKRNTGPADFSPRAYRIQELRDLAVPASPTVDEQGEYYLDKSFLSNAYGPSGGYTDWIQIYDVSQKIAKVNEGIYPNFTAPETGTGLFGENPFRQVAQYYSPGDILFGVTAQGLLSTTLLEDSALQQQGALQLRREFQSRIAQELYQETIGRLNFLEAIKDPIKALDILTGRETLIERDNSITVPKSIVGQGLDFVSRLTGVYVPYSYIPGNYFRLEPPRGLGTAEKIISDITGILGSLVGIPRRRQSPSQRFLDYTGGGSKSQLFKHIRYNTYGPQYGEGAQAQTAVGAAFGETIDVIAGGIFGLGNFPPNPPQYIGTNRNRIVDMTSPPDSTYAGKNYIPQYGPDAVAKEFDSNDYNFGLNGIERINQGSIAGGFTWYTNKTPGSGFLNSVASLFDNNVNRVGPQVPGQSQGQEGSTDDMPLYDPPDTYGKTKSTNYEFRESSLMDVTQQIVDSVPKGGAALKSVSHAINQVSKVFNDGYKELTKGSRVKRYVNTNPVNPNIPGDVGTGAEVAREYCRIWTKDVPYYTYGRLIKNKTNHRKETYSVLDSPYNLNIAPWKPREGQDGKGAGSTNIVDGKVKKYMFSLENLAWRSSGEKGYTYDDLPSCEKGPNQGRIMWFPPYDLRVDESSNANWTENNFVGRPEPVYTYNNTNRTGTLNFKIVVDHPSITNVLIRKELDKMGPKESDALIDSFFAGCKTYDIYDLARKWPEFSINELSALQQQLNVAGNDNKNSLIQLATQTKTEDALLTDTSTNIPTFTTGEYPIFYFENDVPGPASSEVSSAPFNTLATSYLTTANATAYQGQALEADKEGLQSFFVEAIGEYDTKWPAFATKLYKALKDGYTVTLEFKGGASSIATSAYNEKLSKRRLNSVKQLFENYTIDGSTVFKDYLDTSLLFPNPQALGESQCENVPDSGVPAVYSVGAAKCRKVLLSALVLTSPPPIPAPVIRKPRPIAKKTVANIDANKNTRREIANTVLMKMVTECNYFDMIEETDPFIYDALKEKFKYFHPAFHAITPEGLNSRLTFLNQCVRPGSTIPTKESDGTFSRNAAAKNTSFGAPPICVLRVGDFYNTKIAIDNVSFTYDDNLLDLNPEGIGVQPMIASVSITFKYLGGQGLKEPVSRLQNALSFNFFANTEMYDPRSVLTVTDEDPDEAAWLEANKDLLPTPIDPEIEAEQTADADTSPNDGITIGNRENPVLTVSGETGTIRYQNNFKSLNEKAHTYFEDSFALVQEIVQDYNYGWLEVFYSEKEWDYGEYYQATTTPSTTPIEGALLGIPVNWQNRVDSLVTDYRTKIEDETTYIQQQFETTNPSNSQKRKLKSFLEEKLEDAQYALHGNFEQWENKMRQIHVDYLKQVTPMNIVNRGGDGFAVEGNWTTFQLSGGTPVDETSSPPQQPNVAADTLEELGTDYFYLTNNLTCYANIMNGAISSTLNVHASDNPNDNAVEAQLTKEGKYQAGTIQFIETSTESPLLTPNILYEYMLFSNGMLDKSTVDNEIKKEDIFTFTTVLPSDGYKNGNGEFFTDLKEALTIAEPEPVWISDMRILMNEAIALNENFYLRQLYNVELGYVVVLAHPDEGIFPQGLQSPSVFPSTNSWVIKNEKTRELNYTKIDSTPLATDIALGLQEYNAKRNVDVVLQNHMTTSFNLKFT